MPVVTIMPSGKSITAEEGVNLLQAILSAGEPLLHKCDGKADCGSCHIFVLEGRKSVSKIQRMENEKLDTLVGVGSKSRLACQTFLGPENVTIEILSFN